MTYRFSEHFTSNATLTADLDAANTEITTLSGALGHRFNTHLLDARFGLNDQQALNEYFDLLLEHEVELKNIQGIYYFDASLSLPDSFWEIAGNLKYLYLMDFSNVTGAASLPDIPPTAHPFTRLRLSIRESAGNSIGSAGITDVPLTWRNAVDIRTIYMERQELTSAQQVSIVQGIEREILAGMSSAYTATGTTTRFISLNSAAAGANESLVQADLEALGWSVVNATQMEKMIDAGGGPFRWRVLHNS